MSYAPVIITTLCRYEHFRKCIESLAACTDADKTEVYVALDYPATDAHREGYEKIKSFLDKAGDMGLKKLHVVMRLYNYGVVSTPAHLSNLDDMVSVLRKKYAFYILSEDDNVFSPDFLVYMNTCLEKYKDDDDVLFVSGYSYPVKWKVAEGATVFRQQFCASMWGVGMWTEKERAFEREALGGRMMGMLPEFIRGGRYRKMLDVSLDEYLVAACRYGLWKEKMLMMGSDICRRAWLAVADKYAVSPVVSKVRNMGFDGSGVYCQTIETEQGGDTARTYNYSTQPIDTDADFRLVEDTGGSAEENRRRLNAFDCRTGKEMAKARRLLWLCTHTGVWTARLYAALTLPLDLAPRALRKMKKIWKR